ncbi:MAG: hypothetical protein GYA24_05540, partial [Candidatus Lokiarchaeota archaeon]|nr:hypothetical protein [Candidatus Lokiarchaeota archaeon]
MLIQMGKPVHVPEPEAGIPFVDTHCHVTDRNFKGSLPPPARQLADYRAAGGQFIVVCSIDVESAMDSLAFARENEGVHFSCGWAPQNIAHAPIDKEKKEFA